MSTYYRIVAHLNIFYLRFLVASIALHFVVLFMMSPAPRFRVPQLETIPVSIVNAPESQQAAVTKAPAAPRVREMHKPAVLAKKDTPRPAPKTVTKSEPTKSGNETIARSEHIPPPSTAPAPAPREIIVPEQTVITERPLPTIKELLPPANWSSTTRTSGPVSLNTSDPVYLSYFTKIKQSILARWEYPELALRYGLEGRLSVEFTITGDGQLERLRVVRSSGSHILDEEALRAIQAAAPFPPIPRWIQPNPLPILGEMIYDDNRVNYQPRR